MAQNYLDALGPVARGIARKRMEELLQGQSGPGADDIAVRALNEEFKAQGYTLLDNALPPPVTPMPGVDDDLKRAQQRRRYAAQRQRSGRRSTILSMPEETLG